MSAYLVVDIDVHDPKQYAGYVAEAPSYVEKHGGNYIVRGGNAELVEGEWCPQRFVVVEFPSKAHAQAFLDDTDLPGGRGYQTGVYQQQDDPR